MLNKEKFLKHLYSIYAAMDENCFTYDIVENVVDYAIKNFNSNINELKSFLLELIPELTSEDIIPFLTK